MILRKDGDDLILIETEYDDEDQFVALNPGFIKVENLPYSISGFYKYDIDGNIVTNDEKDLQELKRQRMMEIQDKFNDMLNEGYFESSLGFVVDNRRGNGKDDKDNVSSLIDMGQEPVYFRDHNNNFQSLTLDQLRTLKQEMIQDGLSKYQWKWNKENEIMSAETIDDVMDVII